MQSAPDLSFPPVPVSLTMPPGLLPPVSRLQLALLRAVYLFVATGTALVMWPTILFHAPGQAGSYAVVVSLLGGIGLFAALGLRYPLRMLPILILEMTWKIIYLTAFALPLWLGGTMDDATTETVTECLLVVIIPPVIPWRYAIAAYLVTRGDPWL